MNGTNWQGAAVEMKRDGEGWRVSVGGEIGRWFASEATARRHFDNAVEAPSPSFFEHLASLGK